MMKFKIIKECGDIAIEESFMVDGECYIEFETTFDFVDFVDNYEKISYENQVITIHKE